GAAALVVYYSLLHPKSTEIWQGFLKPTCSAEAVGDDEVAGDSSQSGQSLGMLGHSRSLAGEGTVADPKNISPLLKFRGCLDGSWTSHHRWLLVELALKTGDTSVISAAFGDDGAREVCPGGWVRGKLTSVDAGENVSLPIRETGPQVGEPAWTEEKLLAEGGGGDGSPSTSTARRAQKDRVGQEPGFPPVMSFPRSFSPDPTEGSSVYFSAGSITSPGMGMVTATCMALLPRDNEAQHPPG
ncbi:XK-related protein 5, partial [Chaetura pelagica]